MLISEKDSDVRVTKIKMSCDDYHTDIDDKLLIPRNGFYVIVGSAGSGKTNVLIWLLSHKKNFGWNNKFDKVFYFSPSVHTIGKKLALNEDRVFNTFNASILDEILEENHMENQELIDEGEEPNQSLFIFDDLITELKKKENVNSLMKLIYNRRHQNAYIVILSQKYNMLPLKLRVSISGNKGALLLFKSQNRAENESIRNEVLDLNKEEFNQLSDYVYDVPYSFIYVRFDRSQSRMYHKNFNELSLDFA